MLNRKLLLVVFVLSVTAGSPLPLAGNDSWQLQWGYQQVMDRFFSEGIAGGDINGDGEGDLVVGPFWFQGPDFEKRHRIQAGEQVDPHGYAPHFFSFLDDFNRDGRTDILHVGFPGEAAYWLEQPSGGEGAWVRHEVLANVDNESPTYADINGDGRRDLICSVGGAFGYATIDLQNPTAPWTFHAISPPNAAGGRFTHGLGYGDVNGDGRVDLLEKNGWWEQPASLDRDPLWKQHPVPFAAAGGSHMFAHDFDGDGDADIVTSLAAHGYGIAWYEQQQVDGAMQFVRHMIAGQTPAETEFGTVFSQPHALKIADLNGDGLMDIVSGKRPWAHGPHGDPESLADPVIYWFQCYRDGEGKTHFIPRLISRASGVGVDLEVVDINHDGWLDVLVANKRGVFVHRQDRQAVSEELAARQMPTLPGQEARPKKREPGEVVEGLEPSAATKQFTAPAGFAVDLIAGEPDLHQPIAFCFDKRGRIWVAEAHTYPRRAEEGQGKDVIRIFEDADGDGRYETKKTFLEGLNLVSGIEVGFGGVWVGAAPYLMFIPDRDGDDRADSSGEILLDGFGYQDTHETLNAFAWGPDGWLYGCQGVFTHSAIGPPGSSDEERVAMNAGVWRYHPVRKEFEVFAHGTSNPWGVTFDAHGQALITACVIPHAYHIIQGGRYQRQAGQHFDPYTFDDLKTIADHAHYAGNIADHAWWGRDEAVEDDATSAAGGGHAHCGALVYLGDDWPLEYRGTLLMHNLHGNRINVDRLRGNGTGMIASHGRDLLFANDPWFRGIGLQLGPDGALYMIDWYDKNACHRTSPEIWDRTNGRLYRLRYGTHQPRPVDLTTATAQQLVDLQGHENQWHVTAARMELMERSAKGVDLAEPRQQLLRKASAAAAPLPQRLHALWAAHGIEPLGDQASVALLKDPTPLIRAWTVQLLCERSKSSADVTKALIAMAREDREGVVQLYLAAALQRLIDQSGVDDSMWDFAAGLASHGDSQFDRNLPLMIWYAINPLVPADPQRAFALARSTPIPQLKEFIFRRAALDPAMVDALVQGIAAENDPGITKLMLGQLAAAAPKLGKIRLPGAWKDVVAKLAPSPDADIRRGLQTLSVSFGDESVFPLLREMARDGELPVDQRRDALQTLARGGDPQVESLALSLLDDERLVGDALEMLGRFESPAVPTAILARYQSMAPAVRRGALDTLTSRVSHARALLDALADQRIPRTDLSAVHAGKIRQLDDTTLHERLTELWGVVGNTPEEAAKEIAALRKKLAPEVLAAASPSHGRLLYQKSCGQCHRLFDGGEEIGPDLTGANRSSLDYLLENIIAPSAIVGKDYQAITVLTVDGRVITGLLREQNDAALVLHDAEKLVTIPRAEVDQIEQTTRSVMPEGILKPFSDTEIADLIRYLQSTSQVPLGVDLRIDPTSGRISSAIEGESAAEGESVERSAPTHGTAAPQGMGGFTASRWSGDQQLWWTGGQPGSTIELKINAPAKGRYQIVTALTKAVDYGIVAIALNGKDLVSGLDLYEPGRVISTGPLLLGEEDLAEGPHTLTITIQGTNPAAVKQYMVGVDYLLLRPVKP